MTTTTATHTMRTPITIQGTEIKYAGKYPHFYTDGKDIYKVIDATCTADADRLLCQHMKVEHNGLFNTTYKELYTHCKSHHKLANKLNYELK